jgi:hypothetical protein
MNRKPTNQLSLKHSHNKLAQAAQAPFGLEPLETRRLMSAIPGPVHVLTIPGAPPADATSVSGGSANDIIDVLPGTTQQRLGISPREYPHRRRLPDAGRG